MRRILSIAICSAALLVGARAGDQVDLQRAFSSTTNNPQVRVAFRNNFGHTTYEVRGPLGFYWIGTGYTGLQFNVSNSAVWNALTNLTIAAFRQLQSVSGGQTNWYAWQGNSNYFPPPNQATNSFSWQFPPEWAGAELTIKATNGQTLAIYGLPAVIGPGGYTLAATVATNADLLAGAQVFIDGQSVASLAMSTSNSNWSAYRPGFDVEFDGTYTGGEWQIRRSDGSIAMSGGIATLGDAAAGRFTLTGTNTGTLWTRVPAGDGMGSAWVPTVVTFQGNNNVVSYSLVNNPAAPTPTPFPTPAPLTSPTPAPTPPAASTNSPVTVSTNVPAPTNDVSVNVEPLTLEEADDGEQQVLDGVGDLSQLVVGIVSDMRTAQTNIIASGAAFSELRLGGVGKNCTFQFGPASITLQTSEPVRAGLKLLILGIGAFAAAAMIRGAVQS